MNFFIANVHSTPPNRDIDAQGNTYSLVMMLIVFGLIFYYMIIRPQKKRTKAHTELMNSLSKGDEVLTTGGLIGRVVKVADNGYILIALNETNKVLIKRDFIAAILPKGTMNSL